METNQNKIKIKPCKRSFEISHSILKILTALIIFENFSQFSSTNKIILSFSNDSETSQFQHDHSYHTNPRDSYETTNDFTEYQFDSNFNNSYKVELSPLLDAMNKSDCTSLFPSCICSFQEDIQRYFLYCNDPSLKRIPDFKSIYHKFEQFKKNRTLIFSKIDFSQSGIKRIKKGSFDYIQFDLLNPHIDTIDIQLNEFESGVSSFENYVEHLKQIIVPMYHLEFDNIEEIDDGSFEIFVANSVKLNHEMKNKSLVLPKINISAISAAYDILLKLKFNRPIFNFVANRKPFFGLKALQFHINEMINEYLSNSIFDQSFISELFIENSMNFVGFVDLNDVFPSGKLLKRFIAVRSYKIEALCSHSLPSFVDQESFSEIIIKKCQKLNEIREFTFYKYPHLKTLILASNNFSKLEKNSLRYKNVYK